MQAVCCDEPGRLSLVQRPRPDLVAGAARVAIRRVGVCGTDLHIFQGKHPYLEYPRVIGHELGGEIVETGEGCTLEVGTRVSVIPYLPCGTCVACRRGRTNCCTSLAVLGVHIDGGMCEEIVMPEANLVPVGDLSLDAAAMVEFLAIGAHGVRRAAMEPEDRVLVVGAGPIGMSALIFAKARGATTTVLDLREDRLGFCTSMLGADHTVVAGDDTTEHLAKLTDGEFYDVVIDATGNIPSMNRGLGFVAHAGRYVLLGIVLGDVTFSDPEFHKRETTLLASRNATPEDFDTVIEAIRAGKVPVEALATHRAAIADAPAGFPEWIKPEAGVIKALIEV